MSHFLPFRSIHGIFQARDWSRLPFPHPVAYFCQNSSLWPIHLKWPCMAWLIASLSYASPFTVTRLWSMKGIHEFDSDDHYIYYSRQESLRRNGVALIVNKRSWNAVLGCNLKNGRMISVRVQGKSFNITVIQVCAPTTNAKKLKLVGLTPKKISFIHHRGLEYKRRKSRDTWNDKQVWPWSTKWSRTQANKSFVKRTCWT